MFNINIVLIYYLNKRHLAILQKSELKLIFIYIIIVLIFGIKPFYDLFFNSEIKNFLNTLFKFV